MGYIYQHWAKIGLGIAAVCFPFFFYFEGALFWIWIQIPVYLVHEFEEHGWPGGFREFANREILHKEALTVRNVFWINLLTVWILFPVCALLAQGLDLGIGVFLPWFSLFNAATHVGAWAVLKKYNPGLGASLALNIPVGIAALVVLGREGVLGFGNSLAAIAAAFLIHLAIILYAKAR